jgi:putative ABC transport system permease protein
MLRQILAVTALSLRGIPHRLATSCVIVIGIMAVVGVLVSVQTMSSSLSAEVIAAGRADRAIVLKSGSNSEVVSELGVAEAATIENAPGIARGADGKPAATTDFIVSVNVPRRSNGSRVTLNVRGVSKLQEVRPEIELVEGNLFTPGRRELIAGYSARGEFEGLEIGDRVALRNSEWTVVGIYQSGDIAESGLIGDTTTLLSAYQRARVSSVTVRLASPDSFEQLKAALTTDPTLSVDVLREPEYFASLSENVTRILSFVTIVVSGIMTAGALFGALNMMYSAVSSRRIEIATLRALGFGATGVVASVLLEAMLLALLGATAGAALAWALFSGDTISLGREFGSIATQLEVTPATLLTGVVGAAAVGLLGAALPAVRAARLPVATALRAI